MKVRTEISDTEEIVIRHRAENDKFYVIKELIKIALREGDMLILCIDNDYHFVPKNEILFFESGNGKVYAHTKVPYILRLTSFLSLRICFPPPLCAYPSRLS